jgi:hypothetical protein
MVCPWHRLLACISSGDTIVAASAGPTAAVHELPDIYLFDKAAVDFMKR